MNPAAIRAEAMRRLGELIDDARRRSLILHDTSARRLDRGRIDDSQLARLAARLETEVADDLLRAREWLAAQPEPPPCE